MAIETVIFDLGGVLIDWNPRYLFRKLLPDSTEMEYFLSEICSQEWNEQQDAGQSFSAGMEERAQRFPKYRDVIFQYLPRWEETLGGPIPGTVDLLGEVKKAGLKTYALTNWSAETFPIALRKFDFLGWFDGILVSGQEKMKKPDPRFFQLLFERYGIDPSRSVFLDDVPHNVEAAQKLGLQAIRFESPVQARKDFSRIGLL